MTISIAFARKTKVLDLSVNSWIQWKAAISSEKLFFFVLEMEWNQGNAGETKIFTDPYWWEFFGYENLPLSFMVHWALLSKIHENYNKSTKYNSYLTARNYLDINN